MKPKEPIAWRRRVNINAREIAFSAAEAWAQENAGCEYWMRNPDSFGRAVAAVAQGVKLQLGSNFKLALGDQVEARVDRDLAEIRRVLSSWDASGVPVTRGEA